MNERNKIIRFYILLFFFLFLIKNMSGNYNCIFFIGYHFIATKYLLVKFKIFIEMNESTEYKLYI